MSVKTVDARGLACPKPIILTKKALTEGSEEFAVLIDNETSKDNVLRFLSDNSVSCSVTKNNGVYTLSVSPSALPLKNTAEDEYCAIPQQMSKNGNVVCVTNSVMGGGDDELGAILMKGFISTLKQLDPLPKKIILYNAGAKLAILESAVLPALKELEKAGVAILVCGTCADFYEIKEKVSVGVISNMYEIVESLNTASKVIYP